MQTTSRLNTLTWFIVILSIGWALWLFNPFQYYFLNDDLIHIPLSKQGVWFQRRSFRPLADLSVRLDYILWQTRAWGYHLTNLLLHLANTVLVFFFVKKFFKRYSSQASSPHNALYVAVLFFVYAFHSESVFWILGRSGSLGSLFFLLSVLFYLDRSRGLVWYMASLLSFALGLLAYESIWIFPLVAILFSYIDVRYRNADLKRQVGFIMVIIIMFGGYLFARYKVINELIGSYEGSDLLQGHVSRLLVNFIKLAFRAFVPPMQNTIFFAGLCLLFGAGILLVLLKFTNREKLVVSGLPVLGLLFGLSLLPYLSLGIDTHGVEGERYLYLPSIFACMMIVAVLQSLAISTSARALVWFAIIAFHLVFLTRSAHWYKTASGIVSNTFKQAGHLEGKKRLFIDSLPQQYNGALIFRLGFEEGYEWLGRVGGVDSIIVLSQKMDNRHWSLPYASALVSGNKNLSFSRRLIADTSQQQTYRTQKVPIKFNPLTDAYFRFTTDTLFITR